MRPLVYELLPPCCTAGPRLPGRSGRSGKKALSWPCRGGLATAACSSGPSDLARV